MDRKAFLYMQKRTYSGIQLVRSCKKYQRRGRADDMLVNTINGSEVDCILSGIVSTVTGRFYSEKQGDLLDARVWVSVRE